jgi:hypothetical protein
MSLRPGFSPKTFYYETSIRTSQCTHSATNGQVLMELEMITSRNNVVCDFYQSTPSTVREIL